MIRACLALVAALSLVACEGCASTPGLPTTPREQARAAVLVIAEGVRLADETCAAEALEQRSQPLADRCSAAYSTARSALLVAAGSVDAWDTAQRGEVACATARGATAAGELANAIRSYGGSVPPTLTDGLALYASLVGVSCSAPEGGAS